MTPRLIQGFCPGALKAPWLVLRPWGPRSSLRALLPTGLRAGPGVSLSPQTQTQSLCCLPRAAVPALSGRAFSADVLLLANGRGLDIDVRRSPVFFVVSNVRAFKIVGVLLVITTSAGELGAGAGGGNILSLPVSSHLCIAFAR